MVRALVVGGFLLLSVVVVATAYLVGADTATGNLLVNLGTEIFGILITLAVVDWLLERRRLQERARELAWSTLHGVERAVWVWQGGPRRLGTDELLGLIGRIHADDPVTPGTRGLLISVGSRSQEALDKEARALRTMPALRPVLEELTSLRALAEGKASPVSMRMIVEVLESAVAGAARVLGLPAQRIPGGLLRHRDPSPEGQDARYREE